MHLHWKHIYHPFNNKFHRYFGAKNGWPDTYILSRFDQRLKLIKFTTNRFWFVSRKTKTRTLICSIWFFVSASTVAYLQGPVFDLGWFCRWRCDLQAPPAASASWSRWAPASQRCSEAIRRTAWLLPDEHTEQRCSASSCWSSNLVCPRQIWK